jgi:hypothetical protein
MTLESLTERGFSLVAGTKKPKDERGIIGILILRKRYSNSRAKQLYTCAQYEHGYGEPVPLPQGVDVRPAL